jgi:cytochrome c biogenesis protein CcmG, thiol:disulfide interchange protein DsbE
MKLIIVIVFVFFADLAFSQKPLPQVTLADADGQPAEIGEILNPSLPSIVSFWASWCKPCLEELHAVKAEIKRRGCQNQLNWLIISVDDSRSLQKAKALIKQKRWTPLVLFDENQELYRRLGIQNLPHVFFLDAKQQIIKEHTTFSIGDETNYFFFLK